MKTTLIELGFVIVLILVACHVNVSTIAPETISPTETPHPIDFFYPTSTLMQTWTPTSSPVPPTQTGTPLPTWTSTPVPTLVPHTWIPDDTLITYSVCCGDDAPRFSSLFPPELTLLPDGQLFITTWNANLQGPEVKTTRLSRKETCNLLNSIDQAGFFDYDSSTYQHVPGRWSVPVMGAPDFTISVNA